MQAEHIILSRLTADEGKVLTDGKTYGRVMFLGKDRSADEFWEITDEEYAEIVKNEEIENDGY